MNGVAADTALLSQFSPVAQVLHGIVLSIIFIAASVVNLFLTSRLPYKNVIAKITFGIIKIWPLRNEENL